jgi:protein SCO1/2
MVRVQEMLGSDFAERIRFVSITVDPDRDTPKVLKQYAEAFGANLAGWDFLTGDPAEIRDVEHRYGVVAMKAADGDIDHTFLTSLIDADGNLRVQYLGVTFDPGEFRTDLLSLVGETE